ncbi:hypothetical protein FRC19_004305 [Serendipita sp. 401]|nr:hypothetical protein FRC19_004305 [Serendipita sp. 401]KAG9040585.1 hypothetical protein FS842_002968 [Serendipita sp. 407]
MYFHLDMQDLYLTVQNYGAQAGRSAPNAQDFVVACEELGITPHMLKPKRRPGAEAIAKASKAERSAPAQKPKRRRRKKRSNFEARHANLIPRDLSSPEPDLLPSEEMPHIPNTLRAIHNTTYLPSYPPKHTYIRSPPSPPQRSSLTASLDKRMQNTAKVRAALKNLMDAADIQEEAEENRAKDADGKLRIKLTQSSLVNWQDSFTTTRKRWKVSR